MTLVCGFGGICSIRESDELPQVFIDESPGNAARVT